MHKDSSQLKTESEMSSQWRLFLHAAGMTSWSMLSVPQAAVDVRASLNHFNMRYRPARSLNALDVASAADLRISSSSECRQADVHCTGPGKAVKNTMNLGLAATTYAGCHVVQARSVRGSRQSCQHRLGQHHTVFASSQGSSHTKKLLYVSVCCRLGEQHLQPTIVLVFNP